jgi:septal ring factor EnvC (AmiA/AmiB activator)
MFKYGEYIVSYLNIEKPQFKEGTIVKAGENIGKLWKELDESQYELVVQLHKNGQELSASKWFGLKKQHITTASMQ